MIQPPKHKVFVSFHHDDQRFKDSFAGMMEGDIVDQSVEEGDINDLRISTETIRTKIRDNFIRDATVTVVLIGPCTWQRKHVDWEIGSSLRNTLLNSRCGLLGIILPNHCDYISKTYSANRIPPRLADNCNGQNPYACIYNWSKEPISVRYWIDNAFKRRNGVPPDNSRPQFKNNRIGNCVQGWP